MNIIGVIPARYASTRFPGKPLADIKGKTMIRRVWEQASRSGKLRKVIIATDDQRIHDHVRSFGGQVLMTSPGHQNGTSRCSEVVETLMLENPGETIHAVINIQGDEPFIDPGQIDQLAGLFSNPEVQIGTLARPIEDNETLMDPNVVKVVLDNKGKALYFSRQAIPYIRDGKKDDWPANYKYHQHIGIYGYRSDILQEIVRLKPGMLEQAENLEQLRWLENGYAIHVAATSYQSPSVDTPEDLSKLTNSL